MSEQELLKYTLVGLTIIDVHYTGKNSAAITLYFDDGSEMEVDAQGDDMSHTTINVTTESGINTVNL